MRGRLVVFPVKGRRWCFGFSSLDQASGSRASSPSLPPSHAWSDLWKRIDTRGKPLQENAEIAMDFVADKMNQAWNGLGKAPPGTIKSRIHSFGMRLLSRVKPSEVFLKSVPKDLVKLEITYPASLNHRLVRRRIRHMALRGSAIHKNYYYGSISLIPFTAVFTILPLPNIPFFWLLFRAYSNFRALKGSEKLLSLVSDGHSSRRSLPTIDEERDELQNGFNERSEDSGMPPWVLQPSADLDRLAREAGSEEGANDDAISNICRIYDLDDKNALKFREVQP